MAKEKAQELSDGSAARYAAPTDLPDHANNLETFSERKTCLRATKNRERFYCRH